MVDKQQWQLRDFVIYSYKACVEMVLLTKLVPNSTLLQPTY